VEVMMVSGVCMSVVIGVGGVCGSNVVAGVASGSSGLMCVVWGVAGDESGALGEGWVVFIESRVSYVVGGRLGLYGR